jgi:phage N-6-adenine-methyltransferase
VDQGLMFSSQFSEWETPFDFFYTLHKEFSFGLDAAANEDNAKLVNYIGPPENALELSWSERSKGEAVYLNPPYGRKIGLWVAKARQEGKKVTVGCLLPARTDTAWFHTLISGQAEVRLLRGRLKFGKEGTDKVEAAPFPSMVVIYGPKVVPVIKTWNWKSGELK